MVISFSGWNDAGEGASGALNHLMSVWSELLPKNLPLLIADVDPEEFYDFQVNRPRVFTDETNIRSISWPSAKVYAIELPHLDRDLVLVVGEEPSMRWRSFTHEILNLADDLEVSILVTLGSLLADIPHSRPISVGITTANSITADRFKIEISNYEGPTGILGAIHDECLRRGVDGVALWAPVPHYASGAPSPKVALALIHALEDFLGISIPQDELELASDTWEREIDSLTREDSDVADYVKSLEESKDAVDIPDISGEMIAKEFERYLRRKSKD